jgi:hypothetical protein
MCRDRSAAEPQARDAIGDEDDVLLAFAGDDDGG